MGRRSRRVAADRLLVLLTAHATGVSVMTVVMVGFLDLPQMASVDWLYCVLLGPLTIATYLSLFRALEAGPLALVSSLVAGWAAVTLLLALGSGSV